MAKYYVKGDNLNEEGENLSKYASLELDKKIDELINLKDSFKWNGPTYRIYLKVYQERVSKLKEASKEIENYGKFMMMASEKYDNTNKKIMQKMDLGDKKDV